MRTALIRLSRRWATDIRALAALVILALAVIWAVQPNAFGLGQQSTPTSLPITQPAADLTAEATTAEFLGQHTEPGLVPEEPFTWSGSLGLILKVAIVIALIYLSARGLQFLMVRVGVKPPVDGLVEVLNTTTLGPRKTLHVVAIGNRVLLLGSTDQNVAMLSEITDPVEVLQIRERAGLELPHTSSDGHFARRLDDALSDPDQHADETNGLPLAASGDTKREATKTGKTSGTLRSTLARLQATRSRLQEQTDAVRRTTTPGSATVEAGTRASEGKPAASAATAAIAAVHAANQAAARQAYSQEQSATEDQGE